MEPTLSQMLKLHADELERELEADLSPEEREEARSSRMFASRLAEYVVLSRELFANNGLSQLDSFVREKEDAIKHLLDEYYSLRQIEKVPSMVRRTLQLSRLSALQTPSAQTNRYISEAIRAYIQGFAVAATAISRSALEQALKEKLGMQGDGIYREFRDLANMALEQNLLSRTGSKAAKDLARRCNLVLHERPLDDEDAAFTILVGVRSLLEELYSTKGSDVPS